MRVDIWSVSPLAVLLLVGLLAFLRRRGRTYGYLVCVTAFFFYLMVVARWAVFPLRFDAAYIETFRRETTLAAGINLIPFRYEDGLSLMSVQVFGNFLLGVPFGFGLPFLGTRRWSYVVVAAALFSAGIELIQFLIDLAYGFAYRTIDINDFLLVWFGAIAGYVLFLIAAMIYKLIIGTDSSDQGIWTHAHNVLTK